MRTSYFALVILCTMQWTTATAQEVETITTEECENRICVNSQRDIFNHAEVLLGSGRGDEGRALQLNNFLLPNHGFCALRNGFKVSFIW